MAYATLTEVRALDGLDDSVTFPDATITEAIAYAEDLIDTYCGTSFEHKAFTVTVEATRRRSLVLPVLFIQTISSVSVDGTSVDVEDLIVFENEIKLDAAGTFAGNLVEVSGTAGASASPPPGIAWAARTLARQYVLDLVSRVPDRALSIQSDFGQVRLAQAGGRQDRPTSLPDVNAVLNRHRHRVFGGLL